MGHDGLAFLNSWLYLLNLTLSTNLKVMLYVQTL